VEKGTSWLLTVSTSDDSSSGFGKAVNENSASIIYGILDVFANGWQCKEKGNFVGLGYLDVLVLETDVGREVS
jgi:hypothetical protein